MYFLYHIVTILIIHFHLTSHTVYLTILFITPSAPEIDELNKLTTQYYEMRDELKMQNSIIDSLEQAIGDASSRLTTLTDKNKQLAARQ